MIQPDRLSQSQPESVRSSYDSADRHNRFDEEWTDLVRFRRLVQLWTLRNIRLRYKRSLLGVGWTLLEPLLIVAVLATVFSAVFRFQIPNYPVYALSGWMFWDFFSRSTQFMANEMATTSGVAQQVYLPRSAFVVAALLAHLVNWCISLLPLLAVMLVVGHPISPAMLVLPVAMALTAVFTAGAGLMVATLNALFHDFVFIYAVIQSVLFYAVPIIYPLDVVPPQARLLFVLNPLTHFLDLVRAPIYEGRLPLLVEWLTATLLSLASFILGWWMFSASRGRVQAQG